MNEIQIITNEHYDDDVCTFFKNKNTLLVSQKVRDKISNVGVLLEDMDLEYRVIEVKDPNQFVFAKKPIYGPSPINGFIPICLRAKEIIPIV